MNILCVHNFYQQSGGEDQVFKAEADLLESYGNKVSKYTVHNDTIKDMNYFSVAKSTLWNDEVYRELRAHIKNERPEVVHFHNTFPLISPAAYYAAKAEGVPVIQSLHNYRLLCPSGVFLRDGKICEDCLGEKIPWSGVLHRCYRDNRLASTVVAAMLTMHWMKNTWTNLVDVYIANLGFSVQKFIEGGIPSEKLVVKPNFLYPDPGVGNGIGNYALFVGRLAPEKGILTMLEAWQLLEKPVYLKIIGDGPLESQVRAAGQENPNIEWLGRKPLEDVLQLMKKASFLIFPSEWYEGMPMTIIDSLAVGTPILASNIGAMSSLITDEYNGLHFKPNDAKNLKDKVEFLASHPDNLKEMRICARAEFEAKYTAEKNYQELLKIYQLAISNSK